MSFTYSVTGINATLAGLKGIDNRVGEALFVGISRGVLAGQTIVRGKVSGRPGLRVITGDYRRRIVGEAERTADGVAGQIGTNRVDAARHEFGFYGPDALGRVYNYSGYPHFRPSVDEVTGVIVREVISSFERAF